MDLPFNPAHESLSHGFSLFLEGDLGGNYVEQKGFMKVMPVLWWMRKVFPSLQVYMAV